MKARATDGWKTNVFAKLDPVLVFKHEIKYKDLKEGDWNSTRAFYTTTAKAYDDDIIENGLRPGEGKGPFDSNNEDCLKKVHGPHDIVIEYNVRMMLVDGVLIHQCHKRETLMTTGTGWHRNDSLKAKYITRSFKRMNDDLYHLEESQPSSSANTPTSIQRGWKWRTQEGWKPQSYPWSR